MEKNYLKIMIGSLYKKIAVLDDISEENEKQRLLFLKEDIEPEDLEETLERKQELIDKLNELDEGFQSIYDRLKEELQGHPEKYKDEVKEMKELISQITGKSMVVQTEEERNKLAVQEYFSRFKSGIRQARTSQKAAVNYYNNMNKLNHIGAQFMDRKK
ncbi:MAG: flagellar protein FliT [Lachnospiraceae bacterium]|nr:flagellar protein FliT [Lachnospiraceae bacterium]